MVVSYKKSNRSLLVPVCFAICDYMLKSDKTLLIPLVTNISIMSPDMYGSHSRTGMPRPARNSFTLVMARSS